MRLSLRWIVLIAGMVAPTLAHAAWRPFAGAYFSVAQPTNDNFNAHCHTGAALLPYAGLRYNDYLGMQAMVHADFLPPDDDNRGIDDENEVSTLLGLTLGPRLSLPFAQRWELHAESGIGFFSGVSGRLTQTDFGFSAGMGLDYQIHRNLALSAFGHFNGANIAPVPHFLPPRLNSGRPQNPEDQGPRDIRWVTAGIGFRWDFLPPPPEPAPVPEPWVAPPPAPRVQLPPPPPTQVRLPPPPPPARRIVLRDVYFEYDEATITRASYPRLDEAARSLADMGWPEVVVEGHTDARGSDDYNLRLSQRRAEAVRQALIDRGAPRRQLRAVGFGESRPVASNADEPGRAENRRVELQILDRP